MLVLALDTSADIAVSLVRHAPDAAAPAGQPEVLAARRSPEQRRHAEMLAPMITEVLAEAGVDRRELGVVVVGTGPAPFTGLRAGLVTARTLAFALDLPCHGVPSLDALAAEAFDLGAAVEDVLVATDARRRELYLARYRRASGPAVHGPDHVDPDGVLVGGQGAHGDRTGEVEVVAGPAVVRPADIAGSV